MSVLITSVPPALVSIYTSGEFLWHESTDKRRSLLLYLWNRYLCRPPFLIELAQSRKSSSYLYGIGDYPPAFTNCARECTDLDGHPETILVLLVVTYRPGPTLGCTPFCDPIRRIVLAHRSR